MLTILLGTDWIANRDYILQQISDDVVNQKAGRIWIVPEFISHDTERRLSAAAGDTASRFAEVLSFTRLSQRVSQYKGHPVQTCLDNGGRLVAMASAARQLHSRLKAYAAVETRPEFLTGLVEAVDEFKRCCISADDLMAASKETEGSLAQKLEELSLLYSCYDALCQNGKIDPCDQMTWLLEELEDCSFAQEHTFYIDGFPDFTRQHLAIVAHLIANSKQVTICLNCDNIGTKRMAFEKASDTAGQLLRIARDLNIPTQVQSVEPRADKLAFVRQRLFQGDLQTKAPENTVSVFQTETVYQECLVTAQKIRELVCSGARYRDISVVCADPAEYRDTLKMVFGRCNIPAYISGTEGILEKSVIETVLSALETALGGFEMQDVLHYLKSSLTPIALSEADELENYARMWSISGSRWLRDWVYHPAGLHDTWTADAEEKLARLNIARRTALEPLVSLKKQFDSAINLEQQVKALYNFFDEIALRNRLETLAKDLEQSGEFSEAQVLNQLWEILLSALEQLQEVLGHTAWNSENFTHLFRLLLSQYDVGTIPPVLDSVTVGSVSAMRCHQTKHLFVLGAAEGALPGYAGSIGVLSDGEREALRKIGIPLTGGAMEGLQAEFAEIYGVFCSATERITVGCPGSNGSFVYQRLAKIGTQISGDYEISAALCSPLEAGAYFVRLGASEQAKSLGIDRYYNTIHSKCSHTLGDISSETITGLYGKTLNLSASQVDKLADCRLSYFLRYGLRLQEQRKATVDPAEFGTYIHAVLEETAREIKGLGGFRKVSLDDALEIAQKRSEQYIQERFSQIDSKRLNYLFRRNTQELKKIVQELWEELQNSDFEPLDFEVSFGPDGQMPAISITGRSMKAKLRGFVDRIDVWKAGEDTYFRVVDYKTGKKDFDYCDVLNGLGLQMLLYLFALEQEGDTLLGENRKPAGVQYFPARVPIVPAEGKLSKEQADAERSKLWKRKGLILSNEAVLQAMENDRQVVRLPITYKKDGSISGDLADKKQFALLKLYVFGLLSKMVDDISCGNIKPNPYTRGSSHNACTFCPYAAVCHMETVECRRDFKSVSSQRFWEEIEREVGTNG